MNIVNLTPHELNIAGRTIAPSGTVARADADYEQIGEVDGIPVMRVIYRDVSGVPKAKPDTIYVVSGLVRSGLSYAGIGRRDVVAPDTGPTAIRDDSGRIIGVTRLIGVAS